MMDRINRFRRDPRMVAPLSLIAILVVGYAVKQATAGPGAVRVQVREVTPKVQTSVTIPAAKEGTQVEPRNPYYHPALLQSERPEGSVEGEVQPGAMEGLLPMQLAAPQHVGLPRTAGMPDRDATPAGPEPLRDIVVPDPEGGTSAQDPLVSLPRYRLAAVLLGARPAALLITESGDNVQAMLADTLPSGERVTRITSTYVALEGSGWSRLLFLFTRAPAAGHLAEAGP